MSKVGSQEWKDKITAGMRKALKEGRAELPTMLGKHHSQKSKEKSSKTHTGMKYKSMSEKGRKNIGEAVKGRVISKTTKEKQSKTRTKFLKENPEENPWFGKDQSGGKNPHWKGGRSASHRRRAKKRRGFGFIELNEEFEGSEAHHLDREFVMHIPKKLHKSVPHSVTKNRKMDEINDLVIQWAYGN